MALEGCKQNKQGFAMMAKKEKKIPGIFFSFDTMLEKKKSSYSLIEKVVHIYMQLYDNMETK